MPKDIIEHMRKHKTSWTKEQTCISLVKKTDSYKNRIKLIWPENQLIMQTLTKSDRKIENIHLTLEVMHKHITMSYKML